MSEGRKNRYVCQTCGQSIVTVDIEEGVTPFMIGCKATKDCDGDMYSSFYGVGQSLEATFEWYKPTDFSQYPEEHRDAMREHVEMGGLDIRPINPTIKTSSEEVRDLFDGCARRTLGRKGGGNGKKIL